MPPLNLSNISFLKRPVKPVSFALSIALITIAFVAWSDGGVLGSAVAADFLGAYSFLVAGVLLVGWWKNSQRLSEWGLLLAASVWIFRFFVILFINWGSFNNEGLYLSVAWSIVAGGSYLLEKIDPKGTKETGK